MEFFIYTICMKKLMVNDLCQSRKKKFHIYDKFLSKKEKKEKKKDNEKLVVLVGFTPLANFNP